MSDNNPSIYATPQAATIHVHNVGIGSYVVNDYLLTVAESEDGNGYILTIKKGSQEDVIHLTELKQDYVDNSIQTALAEAKASGDFDGKDGITPEAYVFKDNGFAKITITDAKGTTEAEVYDGISPVATVNKHDNVTTLTVTDASGETETEIFDGETGPQGPKGDTGLGIASVSLNSNYILTVNFTDGTSWTSAESLRGPQGTQGPRGVQGLRGETGPQGPKGDKGDKGDSGAQIDDTAGTGDTDKTWSADKIVSELANAVSVDDVARKNIDTLSNKVNNAHALTGGTELANGTDLNTIVTVGNYYANATDTATSMLNLPSGFAHIFRLYVINGRGYDGSSTNFRIQRLVDGITGEEYVRSFNGARPLSDPIWTDWRKMNALLETEKLSGKNVTLYKYGNHGLLTVDDTFSASGIWTTVGTFTNKPTFTSFFFTYVNPSDGKKAGLLYTANGELKSIARDGDTYIYGTFPLLFE